MSAKAQAKLDSIRTLPIHDRHALLRELGQSIGRLPAPASGKFDGAPLPDQDMERSARVALRMLDQEEKRAESR